MRVVPKRFDLKARIDDRFEKLLKEEAKINNITVADVLEKILDKHYEDRRKSNNPKIDLGE